MRVKRGVTKQRRHKKVLKLTKGYRASNHRLFRRANEAMQHAGQYSRMHRRHRRGQMRRQWIQIISAGLHGTGKSYSEFANELKQNNIELNRKVLAEIAQSNPQHFHALVEKVS